MQISNETSKGNGHESRKTQPFLYWKDSKTLIYWRFLALLLIWPILAPSKKAGGHRPGLWDSRKMTLWAGRVEGKGVAICKFQDLFPRKMSGTGAPRTVLFFIWTPIMLEKGLLGRALKRFSRIFSAPCFQPVKTCLTCLRFRFGTISLPSRIFLCPKTHGVAIIQETPRLRTEQAASFY